MKCRTLVLRSILIYFNNIIGEYVLTVEDLANGKVFDDAIAYSLYGWDLPDPKKPSLQPDTEKRNTAYKAVDIAALRKTIVQKGGKLLLD